jgi:signal transduction histidine kinase
VAYSSHIPSKPPAGTLPGRSLRHLAQYLWRDRLLLSAFLGIHLLVGYQLAVTLLQPAWANFATDWLRAAVAWLALVVLILVGWRFLSTDRRRALPWLFLSIALLAYALGQSLSAVYHLAIVSDTIPFPWWADLVFLLEYPCYFLTLALWPSPARPRRPGLVRWRVVLDSLLLMGAVTSLFWYFLLAPIYLQSQESLFYKGMNLVYASGDLGVIFGLILILGPWRQRRGQTEQVALILLILAAIVLILGDTWFAWLQLSGRYTSAAPPALFWLYASLLAPLAGLVYLRLPQDDPPPQLKQPHPWQEHDLSEALRFLLPFVAALLASALIGGRTIIAPVHPMHPLIPCLVIFGLLLLVILRQGILLLEQAQLRRERTVAQASELAMRDAKSQMEAFLGIVSHELKTPVSSILLGLEMIQRRAQRAAAEAGGNTQFRSSQGALETTIQQLGRLGRLVDDLVDISRIQSGRMEFTFKPVDLVAIVRLVVEEQRQAAPERAITLHLSGNGSVSVYVDAERVEQVVTNFLTNALKYSGESALVEVGVQEVGQQARVWVRDQGPGIAQEEHEVIWERFHRAAGIEVQSGSGIGLGLGLHISKTIIERHHGQVGVESAPGLGSTFWFRLPLALPGEACPGRTEEEENPDVDTAGQQP